jgi:hypothetical protein
MAISTFGGAVASNSNNTISGIIGAPVLAPAGFTSASYVDTGTNFDPAVYPSLAAVYPAKFNGSVWDVKQTPAMTPLLTSNAFGAYVSSFVMGSDLYVLFANGHVFKTTGGNINNLAYFKQIYVFPSDTINTAVVAGGNLYLSYVSGKVQVFTDVNLNSVKIVTNLGAQMYDVKYGNGVWLVGAWYYTGAQAALYRSTDGFTFTSVALTSANYNAPEYGNGTWVMTNGANPGIPYTSTDGSTWTARTAPLASKQFLGGAKFSSTLGMFAAAVTNGVATSTNGISWTAYTVANTQGKYMTTNSNGGFIAATGSAVSNDGVIWTSKGTTPAVISGTPVANPFVPFGTTIIEVGSQAASGAIYSLYVDTSGTLDAFSSKGTIQAVGYPMNIFPPANNGGTWLTVENISATTQTSAIQYAYSTNSGTSWSYSTLPVTNLTINGCFATPTKFVVWGLNGTTVTLMTTSDAVTWTTKTFTFAGTNVFAFNNGESIFFAGGQYLARTDDYGTTFATSILPVTLTTTTTALFVTGSGSLNLVVSTGSCYVSVNNGTTWTTNVWGGLALSTVGAKCIGTKASLVILTLTTSPAAYMLSVDNGQTWQQYAFPAAISPSVKSAFFVNGYYFVYLGNNAYYYSADAINWISMTTGTTSALQQPWSQSAASNGVPFLTGQVGTFLTGNTSTYNVPYIPTNIAGTKYTVRAQ